MLPSAIQNTLGEYTRTFTDFETIQSDNVIVTSDWELPDVDPNMLLLVRAFGEHYHISDFIAAGDLVASDQAALTRWPELWKPNPTIAFGRGITLTIEIIRWFSEVFKNFYAFRGNHDDRLPKATAGEIHLGMFLEMAGIPFSQYNYLYIETSRGPVKVIHPYQYSSDSLKLAQKFYNVSATPDGRKPHIVIAHTHQAQSGSSPDKLRECHALGCLRHPLLTQYQQTTASTFPGWDRGFLMIKNGYFHPIVLGRTDLRAYLPENLIPASLR